MYTFIPLDTCETSSTNNSDKRERARSISDGSPVFAERRKVFSRVCRERKAAASVRCPKIARFDVPSLIYRSDRSRSTKSGLVGAARN